MSAKAPVIEIDNLLIPFSEDNPAGAELRYASAKIQSVSAKLLPLPAGMSVSTGSQVLRHQNQPTRYSMDETPAFPPELIVKGKPWP